MSTRTLPGGADPLMVDEYPGYRLVWSRPMVVAGQEVRCVASQLDDGTVVDPLVYVGPRHYTVEQVRDLIESMACAANIANRWVAQD